MWRAALFYGGSGSHEYYHSANSNTDSEPWPDPLRDWVIGDNLYPPDFNTVPVDDETAQPGPTTEMGGFTNLSTPPDYHDTNQVSKQHVSTLTLTYSAVLQNDLHPWCRKVLKPNVICSVRIPLCSTSVWMLIQRGARGVSQTLTRVPTLRHRTT